MFITITFVILYSFMSTRTNWCKFSIFLDLKSFVICKIFFFISRDKTGKQKFQLFPFRGRQWCHLFRLLRTHTAQCGCVHILLSAAAYTILFRAAAYAILSNAAACAMLFDAAACAMLFGEAACVILSNAAECAILFRAPAYAMLFSVAACAMLFSAAACAMLFSEAACAMLLPVNITSWLPNAII